MRIVIPDDYQDAVRTLDCFPKLAGHSVTVFNDTVRDVDVRWRSGFGMPKPWSSSVSARRPAWSCWPGCRA